VKRGEVTLSGKKPEQKQGSKKYSVDKKNLREGSKQGEKETYSKRQKKTEKPWETNPRSPG